MHASVKLFDAERYNIALESQWVVVDQYNKISQMLFNGLIVKDTIHIDEARYARRSKTMKKPHGSNGVRVKNSGQLGKSMFYS